MTSGHQNTAPWADLAPMETPARLARLREALAEAGLGGLIVTNKTNVRYLTGFGGSAGSLWVGVDEAVLLTDARYADVAPAALAAAGTDTSVEIEISSAPLAEVFASRLRSGAQGSIGVEADAMTSAAHALLVAGAGSEAVTPTEGLVAQLRRAKDDGEIARIERAAQIADVALAAVEPMLADRPRELAIAAELDYRMRLLGADGSSFPTIVGSGPNGALPHSEPGERVIAEGELVVIDFGALVDGYHSDMTRTLWVGDLDAQRAEMVEVTTAAQAAGVEAAQPGVEAREVDAACRSLLTDAGYGEAFTHGTGHGVGLDIHEWPAVAARSTATLELGHVVTVEPGVYLRGLGGVRVEDTIVIGASGNRPLTLTPKRSPSGRGAP